MIKTKIWQKVNIMEVLGTNTFESYGTSLDFYFNIYLPFPPQIGGEISVDEAGMTISESRVANLDWKISTTKSKDTCLCVVLEEIDPLEMWVFNETEWEKFSLQERVDIIIDYYKEWGWHPFL